MKKIIITFIILFTTATASAETWSNDDLYLFSAVVSAQLADYSQSIKFNEVKTFNDCRYQIRFTDAIPSPSTSPYEIYQDCQQKSYLRGAEGNPLVRREDGGFDGDRAIILSTILDASVFYVATKYPRWRRPLLYLIYSIQMLAISNNHSLGYIPDTPVLPIIFTYQW